MATILLTAGTSKLFSEGGFQSYYGKLFQGDLRIQLPPVWVEAYLNAIPFIELVLGAALLVTPWKHLTVYGWYMFMLTLLVGHYILEEWSSVNQLLDYFFLGMICHALPTTKKISKSSN